MFLSLIAALALGSDPSQGATRGRSCGHLWLVQRYGTAEASDPVNDQRIKGTLFKALAKDGELTLSELDGLMEPEAFKTLAGSDDRINADEIRKSVETAVPESRSRLRPEVRKHVELLTTSYDLIDEKHRLAGQKLADWIAKNYRPGKPLDVVVVCTGNSRRSILGATMGNIAAAYYGMPEVRFYSGGTAPTAFNSRTVACAQGNRRRDRADRQGSPRGEPQTANPMYRVRWGAPGGTGEPALETTEFSKKYDDPANPQEGFAALMVCGEADAACPFVKGAAVRVSMPYLDPKIYDGSAYESAKYAERRDDMGRLMLAVMMQARRGIELTRTARDNSVVASELKLPIFGHPHGQADALRTIRSHRHAGLLRPREPKRVVHPGIRGRVCFGSAYGFLQGAWPFGLVEAVWALVAVYRWRSKVLSARIRGVARSSSTTSNEWLRQFVAVRDRGGWRGNNLAEDQVGRQVEDNGEPHDHDRQPEPGRHDGLRLFVAQPVYVIDINGEVWVFRRRRRLRSQEVGAQQDHRADHRPTGQCPAVVTQPPDPPDQDKRQPAVK